MSDNKTVDSSYQYGYTTPPPVEGELTPPPLPEEGGILMPIRDQLTSSQTTVRFSKTPPVDNPQAPIPTPKAIQIAETKRAIAKEAKINEWLKNPSYLGLLFAKIWDYFNNLSKTRFSEAETRNLIEERAFSLRMDNAELSKQMRDLAADKEFIRACTQFINAGVSCYQLGGTIQARGKAASSLDPNSEKARQENPLVDKLHQKREDVKEAKLPTGTEESRQAQRDQALTQDSESKKKLESDLAKVEEEHRAELRTKTQEELDKTRLKGEIMKSLTEGVASVATALKTKEEGLVELEKGRNEALLEITNRLKEGTQKSYDSVQAQLDKILQQIVQTSSEETRAHSAQRS
jgi:hypothetical protein